MSHPLSDEWLLKYLEGELSKEEVDAHADRLEQPEVQARLKELRKFLGDLSAPDPSMESIDVASTFRAKVDGAKGRRRSWWAWASVAAAAAAILFVVAPQDEFRSKSANPITAKSWTGIQVYAIGPSGAAHGLGAKIQSQTPLAIQYTNRGPNPYHYLMVFGVDATGEVRWYHPAYTDPTTDPASIQIREGAAVTLPDKIVHDLPKGALTIHGLFTRQPLRVREIERRVQAGDLNLNGALDHTLKVEVR